MANMIELNNISIDIPIFDAKRSFRQSLANRLGGKINRTPTNKVVVRALDNIFLTLQKGDRLGLIGHNGAGKTTLLRLLAHIYKPTQGQYICHGNVTSLFNINLGMDLDDTGIENIKSVGMFLGMTKKEVAAKQEDIIAFSELGDFINLPVRTYSAGMLTRLSFALATSTEPEILLMDEAIGAGDNSFAEKAEQRLAKFYKKISTLVLASHSTNLIKQLCNKAILMEHGCIKAMGEIDEIFDLYQGEGKVNKSVTNSCLQQE